MKTVRKLFQYYLPVTLTLFMTITIKRAVITDGVEDRLYGLPFAYITNNVFCSGCYEVYISALVADLAFYYLVVFLLFKAIEKAGPALKTHWLGITFGVLVTIFWLGVGYLVTADSAFLWKNNYPITVVRSELSFEF